MSSWEDDYDEILYWLDSDADNEVPLPRDLRDNSILGFIASLSSRDRSRLREALDSLMGDLSGALEGEMAIEGEAPRDLLFVGSDGKRVVKGFHYSREVLGEDGPVILPSSSPFVIIGAFSDEYIREGADEIESSYDTYEEQQAAWEQQMAHYAILIAEKHDESPPLSPDDFLRSID